MRLLCKYLSHNGQGGKKKLTFLNYSYCHDVKRHCFVHWSTKSCNLNDCQDLLGLQGKPEGKTVHGSLRCWWHSNIKVDLDGVGWINLAQSRGKW
jgi:hypothetical protein